MALFVYMLFFCSFDLSLFAASHAVDFDDIVLAWDMLCYNLLLLLLQPFYGPLDFVWDYSGEPVTER